MRKSLGALTVDLILKLNGFEKGMDRAARESEKGLKRIQAQAKTVGTAIGATFAAIGGAQLFRGIIENTRESEEALAQLEARIKSTGNVAGVSVPELQGFANELAGVTTYGDDAIIAMQGLLLSFTNIRGNTVKGATTAILDLATALGTDLNSAATTVGKALNDPVKGLSALSRVGVQFSEDQRELIKRMAETGDVASAQGLILDKLSTQFGGAATAAANTFGGAMEQLKNAFGDLLEVDGGLPEVTSQVQELTKALRSDDAKATASGITSGLVATVSALGTTAAAVLKPISDLILMANDLGAVLDNKVFGERFSLAEQSRLFGVSPRGHGARAPRTPAVDGAPAIAPASEAFSKLDAQLREQIALFGQTSEAAKLAYQIQTDSIEGLTDAEGRRLLGLAHQLDAMKEAGEVARANAQEWQDFTREIESAAQAAVGNIELPAIEGLDAEAAAFFDQLDRGAALTEQMRTPQEQYNATLAELDELLAAGTISQETYSRAMKKAQEDLKGANDMWTVFKDQAARNTQDIIADTLINGFDDGAKGILNSFARMLQELAAQAIAADIAGKLFGKSAGGTGGGWLGAVGSLFGLAGTRADGGPVAAGMPYLVGERGPEVIVPRAPGTVVPNNRLGASMVNNMNITIQAPNEQVGRATATQAAQKIASQLAMAQRRNG